MEIAHAGLADLRIVDSMQARKDLMAELADGFIALPGGIGTLDELVDVWKRALLAEHSKPCAALNVEGFYGGWSTFLDHMVAETSCGPSIVTW